MKKTQAKGQLFLLIAVFLVILIACAAPPATPTKSAIIIATFTAAPANSPAPSDVLTSTLAVTSSSERKGRLPGLSPVNVTVNLEGQKFTCTAVKQVRSHYERTCLKGLPSETLFQVVVSGSEPFLVDFIETSVRQAGKPDNKIAAEFLSSMAALTYEGASAEDAKAWVENTIPNLSGVAQETTFGGVKYILSGPPEAITLEMGELP